jgi:hypothetical protein
MLKVHENISVDYYKEIPEYKPNQMDKAVYTIITILFYSDSASLMKIHDENVENCVIFTEDYRHVYQTHFFLVKLLRVQVLQSKGDTLALNQFTQDALRVMSNFFVAFEIAETFSTKNAKAQRHQFNNATVRQGVVADCEPIDYEEFFKIKTLTSGSVEGYVIIAWHPSVLHQFLDQDNQTVLPKIRATYALQFIFSEKHLCKTIKTEMDNILRRLWIEFNVVNVIAQTPCSCDTSEIYIYRPFVKTDNLWGLTEYYHLQDVTSKFRVITNPLTDLNGCSLKISIFERFPSAVKNLPRMFLHNPIYKNLTWSKGFGSVDGLILGILAEHLNFDVVPVAGKKKNNQGVAFPNGTTVAGQSATIRFGRGRRPRGPTYARGTIRSLFEDQEQATQRTAYDVATRPPCRNLFWGRSFRNNSVCLCRQSIHFEFIGSGFIFSLSDHFQFYFGFAFSFTFGFRLFLSRFL